MIQFDAAFDKRNFKSASSVVVWNRTGKLLTTRTFLNTNVPSLFAARLMRDFYAINLGASLGFPLVTLMGDSRTVLRKCQSMKKDKSVIDAIITDIKTKKMYFQEISFQFIN